MKISYIIDNLGLGGAQVHLAGLVNGISSLPGYDVEIVSLGEVCDEIRKRISCGTSIVTLKMDSVRNPFFCSSFIHLVRLLKRRRPDVIHTYLNTANVFGLAAAIIASCDNTITSRRDMGHFRTDRIGAIERSMSRYFAARVFCVCQAVAQKTRAVERIPDKKIRVLLNGVDTKYFCPRKQYNLIEPLRFGMVATMNRVEKGHADLIEAVLVSRRKSGKRMILRLVGDGPMRGELEKLSFRLGVSDCIHFVGEQGDINSFLDEIDVLVVPSHSEGISNAALEAMARGLPVIATAVDGNLEIVENGKTGILVPVRGHEALGGAMIVYSRDPSMAEEHGRNGRLRVENFFSFEKMIGSYIKEYQELAVGG